MSTIQIFAILIFTFGVLIGPILDLIIRRKTAKHKEIVAAKSVENKPEIEFLNADNGKVPNGFFEIYK